MKLQDSGQPLRPGDKKNIARYSVVGNDLYRRGFSTPLLKCLSKDEIGYVMDKVHNGICGFHIGRRTLKAQVLRAKYFWLTMEEHNRLFVQKCISCQAHANDIPAPPHTLHTLVSLMLFA